MRASSLLVRFQRISGRCEDIKAMLANTSRSGLSEKYSRKVREFPLQNKACIDKLAKVGFVR